MQPPLPRVPSVPSFTSFPCAGPLLRGLGLVVLLGACDPAPAPIEDAGTDAPRTVRDAGPPLGLPPLDCSRGTCWTFAVLSDTHVIDEWYVGPESNPLDTSSILMANDRLARVRDRLNELSDASPIDLALVAGDIVHDFPFDDVASYVTGPDADRTAVAIVRDLYAGFAMPVHLALGNHDYDQPRISRDTTHDIFRAVLGVEPYYAVEHRGLRFLVLNSQLGDTWDPTSPSYDESLGSLGAEQLAWIEAQLSDATPTILIVHHHPWSFARDEVPSAPHPDLFSLSEGYSDVIRLVISGHLHRWIDHEDEYGARHLTMGSTRYDQDAFLLFQADEATGDVELLNPETPVWRTVDSEPAR